MSSKYWPARQMSLVRRMATLVTLASQKKHRQEDARKSVPQSGLSVTHIQYLRWMEDSVPIITSPVLEIPNLVQMGSGNKPIVVMCKYVALLIVIYYI